MRKILFSLILLLGLCLPSFGQEEEVSITRSRTVKEFFKGKTEFRINSDAVEHYYQTINNLSEQVAKRVVELVDEEGRRTILERDIEQASEEVFRRAPMNVSELMEKITQLSIIDMVELSNQVQDYGKKLLESRQTR